MADNSFSCSSCGARVPAGAERCDLCGAPVENSADVPSSSASTGDDASADSPPDAETDVPETGPASPSHVFCNECGHQNPADANYCSRCGHELQDLAEAAPAGTRTVDADLPTAAASASDAPEAAEDAGPGDGREAALGKQVLWMVGVGVVLVVGFFFATQWSQQYEWGGGDTGTEATAPGEGASTTAPSGGQAGPSSGTPAPSEASLQSLVQKLSGPVNGPVADRIDSLRALVDTVETGRRRDLRGELVRLYIGAGAPGRAALVQRQLADATGTVEARRRAADLLYRWMRQVERQRGRSEVAEVARHVAAAYAAVADERPQDLDARTRMGEAYLLTNNPMKGIEAINQVLSEDSTFVPARFQKGLALLQINRLEESVRQFRMVKTFADPQEPFYKQAQRAIDVINERTSMGSQDSTATRP